jgi:hypothetical protein
MTASHTPDPIATPALDALRQFLAVKRSRAPGRFENFERELHEHLQAFERELLTEELARYDVDCERILVCGRVYRRSLRCEETYTSTAGPIRVPRTLYARSEGGATECPLELRAGIVDGRWTPRAAELVAFTMANQTPGECEALFQKLGGMTPSRSSLDRLPRKLSARWESDRAAWEAAIRCREPVPQRAYTLALSVDGVMVPMREAGAAERDNAVAWREAGCATATLYTEDGERILTRRWGRMPQKHKVDLQTQLAAEYAAVKDRVAVVVKISDGAHDNWRLLNEIAPDGIEILDFHHAFGHVHSALEALWGEGTVQVRAEGERLRTILRDQHGGVDVVIGFLNRQARKCTVAKARRAVRSEIRYLRAQRHRMDYAHLQARGLPIGSGVVEAACKTLVTARLKRSGMRWRKPGGQAVLTFRSLQQSDRWDAAWEHLSASYRANVTPIQTQDRIAA